MAAHAIEARIQRYLSATRGQREELGRLERGELEYPPDVIDWQVHEIRKELEAKFDDTRREIAELVESTREAYIASIPSRRQFQAALDNMERAIAIRELAEAASEKELVGLAEKLAAKRDQAGAHGLRVALRTRFDNLPPSGDRQAGEMKLQAQVLEHLDSIHAATHRNALTGLVAAQHLRAVFEVGGPARDMSTAMADPVKALAASNAAQLVPVDDEGGTRLLNSEEFEGLLEEAGYRDAARDLSSLSAA